MKLDFAVQKITKKIRNGIDLVQVFNKRNNRSVEVHKVEKKEVITNISTS